MPTDETGDVGDTRRRLVEADQLIDEIVIKLKAHRADVAKSLQHGRIEWRERTSGRPEIDLNLKF